ncbi:helix-turn-helix domain-containing protein [Streptomyces sp. 3MP-14]|uniref:Helix-turn-helix domain-containing protein n=1 Tax=Streptomyces mimosae TaxID=2586635 RepID=A0A5N5ZPE5_9ACTN|nr:MULTISPECIES: helix-turn-helix domain-containing protein [Streptomyces]KAB8158371.1 helix-turn-helix domain-containing protein [Streptomyces mimosae]KAB8172564.1 helix-turn-helix domain-containing protein [Streptomyces sp. 3MP-14]
MAGVLRIHFTERDFRHVQLARSADPIWEAILGLHVLTGPRHRLPRHLGTWRRRAAERLGSARLRAACRLLNDLAPADAPYFPDFLTPAESEEGMSAALSTLRATSDARLARELREAARHRALPRWTGQLASGDRELLGRVADALLRVHTELVAPDWSRVAATVAADAERRAVALEGGLVALLAGLPPFVWRDPVLTAPYPVDFDLRLRGRGLRLIPSFFCHTTPIAVADPALPPVVVYPVSREPPTPPAAGRQAPALAALLGASRARVLGALTVASTTGSVAAGLGLSASSVSGHLKVLRAAGLVESRRDGARVTHRLTSRGHHLLGH